MSQCCLVDPSFLDLVRYGLRAPDDPHGVGTLPVVDTLLKVETPCAPAWHRYNDDGFGEDEDGAPYDGAGVGRSWPLLTGERGHYERAAGHDVRTYVRALECFADKGGLLPEQVWDAPDIAERDLFAGRGTGAATPLVWAHAEYVKLLYSKVNGSVFDRIEQLYDRYLRRRVRSDLVICKFNHKLRAIRSDQRLRLEVHAPAELRWSADEWATVHHEPMAEIAPGVWARVNSEPDCSVLAARCGSRITGPRSAAGRDGILLLASCSIFGLQAPHGWHAAGRTGPSAADRLLKR